MARPVSILKLGRNMSLSPRCHDDAFKYNDTDTISFAFFLLVGSCKRKHTKCTQHMVERKYNATHSDRLKNIRHHFWRFDNTKKYSLMVMTSSPTSEADRICKIQVFRDSNNKTPSWKNDTSLSNFWHAHQKSAHCSIAHISAPFGLNHTNAHVCNNAVAP